MEIRFNVKFGPDKDFESTDKFFNLLNDGAVKEELEWEVKNVIDTWMNPDRYTTSIDVELLD